MNFPSVVPYSPEQAQRVAGIAASGLVISARLVRRAFRSAEPGPLRFVVAPAGGLCCPKGADA